METWRHTERHLRRSSVRKKIVFTLSLNPIALNFNSERDQTERHKLQEKKMLLSCSWSSKPPSICYSEHQNIKELIHRPGGQEGKSSTDRPDSLIIFGVYLRSFLSLHGDFKCFVEVLLLFFTVMLCRTILSLLFNVSTFDIP